MEMRTFLSGILPLNDLSILYIQFIFLFLVKHNLKHARVIDSEMVAKVSHRKKVLQSHSAF